MNLLNNIEALGTAITEALAGLEEPEQIDAKIYNNMIMPVRDLPAVVIEPLASKLERHGGGTQVSDEHKLGLYIIVKCTEDNTLGIVNARATVGHIADTILAIPRVYAESEEIQYTEDIVEKAKCSLAYFEVKYRKD